MWTFDEKILLVFCLFLSLCYCQDEAVDPSLRDDYSIPGVPTPDCTCVPFFQCLDGNVVIDGRGIINPKTGAEEELAPEEKYIPPVCGPFQVCCSAPEAVAAQRYVHRCGSRHANGINSRILSSDEKGEAEFGEWPWQAAILKQDPGLLQLFACGGTLIDEYHILTVAHCVESYVDEPSRLTVRLGEWDARSNEEFMPHEDFTVERVIIHPEYQSANLYNDIAILRVDKEIEFKPHIDTACLPRHNDSFVGQDCVITGWGTDDYDSGRYANIMKEVSIPVISNEECQEKLRKTRLGRFFRLHNRFMCAGGKDKEDSCKGDGGGPLSCYRQRQNAYVVAGLTSWGLDCGKADEPGVYINLEKYIDWIANQTGKNVEYYWSKS